MARTGEEFKEQAREMVIFNWYVRDCSRCGYRLAYRFSDDHEEVVFDSGCYCTHSQTRNPSSWHEVAAHYNIQTNKYYIKQMNDFWGF